MTDLLDRVLSVATVRTVVRQKCSAGVGRVTISMLIASFMEAAEVTNRDRAERFPLELIYPDRRAAFLEVLQRLPTSRTAVRNEIASLRG